MKFRRGVQVQCRLGEVGAGQLGLEGVQMRFVAGRHLQAAGIHFHEPLRVKPRPDRRLYAIAGQQQRPPVGVDGG